MNLPGIPEALVMLFLLSSYGWGVLCRRFCDRRVCRYYSLTAVLGLAALNALGGVLNLVRGATSPVLFLLMFAGAGMAGRDLLKRRPWSAWFRRRAKQTEGTARTGTDLLPWLLAFGAGIGACLALAPTTVFNPHDDFHTYSARVARLVQTGSVGGSLFDATALDSFGSQSFFQGFFLPGWDITLLNAFDAVACFNLCLLLVAELSFRRRLPWYVGALGVICVMAINPQYVNISPLYSGALVITGLVLAGGILARSSGTREKNRGWRLELTLALLASVLVTLKPTLAFFAFFYLVALYLILLLKVRDRKAVLKSAMAVGLLIVLFVLPWALIHLPLLGKARQLGKQLEDVATLAPQYPSIAAHEIPALCSFAPLLFGDNIAAFNLLVSICSGVGLVCLGVGWRRCADRRALELLSVAAVGVAVPAVYLWNAHLFPVGWAIRYSCPVLIGCYPIACLGYLHRGRPGSAGYHRKIMLSAGLIVAAVVIFAGTFISRIQRAVTDRTLLSFPLTRDISDYSTSIVSREEMLYCQSVQSRMIAGSTALVWTVAPFQLNFRRNRLFTVSEPGLTNPVLHFPAGADLESLRQYLRNWGIRYVMIETSGAAVNDAEVLGVYLKAKHSVYRKLADYSIYFRKSLLDLAERSRVLYSDGRMLLFELGEAPNAAKSVPADR